MRIIKYILSLFLVLLAFACNKEVSENFIAYSNANPLNDTVWVKNITSSAAIHSLADSILPIIYSDTIDAETASYISFPNNLELYFPSNIFSNPTILGKVTGKIVVQVFRLENKGDFILASKTTCSNNIPLESDGALFIRVLQNGKELSLLPDMSYTIRLVNRDNLSDYNMNIYSGIENFPLIPTGFDSAFTWNNTTAIQSKLTPYNKQIAGGLYLKGYQINAKQLRWIALAKPLAPSLSRAKLSVYLPLNFTNKNTLVFAILEDHKTVIQLKADFTSRTFAATDVPTQKKINLISLSVIGSTYYFSKTNIKYIGDTPAFSLQPEKKTLKFIIAELIK